MRVIRWLSRIFLSKDIFLIYEDGDIDLHVKGYTDASFQSYRYGSKSQSAYVFTLNGGAVNWKSSTKNRLIIEDQIN